MMAPLMLSWPRWVLPLLCTLLVGGCDRPQGPAAGGAPGAGKPVSEVKVIEVHPQSVPITRELVGRLASTRVAQVRARVAGVLLERVYIEGTDVEPGQLLFRIDPARLQAEVRASEAALARAQADATNAALTAKRYLELREKKTLSQQDLDTALAAERTTAAAVKQAQANLELARLDLGYADVTAPIAGRAGRSLVTEGTLVGQGEVTLLTTVERIDPIYVNFSQSPLELQDLRQALEPGAQGAGNTKVEVLLPDGSPHPYPGNLDFSDLAVDPGTGALSLRATVPNPDRTLLPGQFVSLRLTTTQLHDAFVLPQAALARDPAGAYVLVVQEGGEVVQRRVQTHGMSRTDWILTGDLKGGDRVILSGLQKVKPGDQARVTGGVGAPGPKAGSGT